MKPGHPPSAVDPSETEHPLWEFVPVAAYKVPSLPARSAAANTWTSIKQLFKYKKDVTAAPVKHEEELHTLSQSRRHCLASTPDWRAAAESLNDVLRDWMHSSAPDWPVRFLVGQPNSGHVDILRDWGVWHKARVVPPPTYEQILEGDLGWFDSWPHAGVFWVLPNLESCYLRHTSGLTLVRELLERAESGRLGRGVIGCESWAWSYLQHVWPVSRVDALTLQAFDGMRLARLFSSMVVPRLGKTIRFRHATSGQDLLTVPSKEVVATSELIQLAARCRGNAGVAAHVWRERLRAAPEGDEPDAEGKEMPSEKVTTGEESVWVSASQPDFLLPVDVSEEMAFVLHTLLLHGALPADVLAELLPIAPHRCMALLLGLRNAGVVYCLDDRWRVHELAYMAVRGLLRGRDYLTDDF